MSLEPRQSTGVPGLDEHLGGGLLPGTLTVVVGATGIGKTQFGLQFARAGLEQESQPGIIFDMTARGDSQSHADYARRLWNWQLRAAEPAERPDPARLVSGDAGRADYLHVFDQAGRRVTRRDLGTDEFHTWQVEINRKLAASIAFFYSAFARGVRRCVVDGIEPVGRPGESIQYDLFEYVYHQILRKDPEWVARDLLREQYRAHADLAARHRYEPAQIGCLLLVTSAESLLDELVRRPLAEGDVLANANTLIFLGRTRQSDQVGRALYIAKHRGSACTDRILPYRVTGQGVTLD